MASPRQPPQRRTPRTPSRSPPQAAGRDEPSILYRLLVENVRDYAIFMLDPAGNVVSWNEGARRLKGYEAEEIVGCHLSVFFPPADAAAGRPQRELAIATRDGRYEEEAWRVRKDGSRFWANVVITALRDDDGELLGFTKVTRDLTERRAAQDKAIADARRLAAAEATNRTKSEFLAALSHELRTPINATLGYAELIATRLAGPVTPQQQEYLARIRARQKHLLDVVSDLLNYSRLEAGRVDYDLRPVPLREVVDAVVAMLEPQATAHGITIDLRAGGDCAVVRADRGKTEQIVLNLLSNAVKFTPPGGRIAVECEESAGSGAIVVSDDGPGIPREQQAAIFEPFVQLGRSLSSGHEGTGLGLSISRDLARAMDGDISVESEPGQGARFTLRLPAAPPPA